MNERPITVLQDLTGDENFTESYYSSGNLSSPAHF